MLHACCHLVFIIMALSVIIRLKSVYSSSLIFLIFLIISVLILIMKKLSHILKSFSVVIIFKIYYSVYFSIFNNYYFSGCECLHAGHLAVVYHLIIIDIRKQVSDNQTRLADVTNRVSGFFTQLKTGIYKLIKMQMHLLLTKMNVSFNVAN